MQVPKQRHGQFWGVGTVRSEGCRALSSGYSSAAWNFIWTAIKRAVVDAGSFRVLL